MTLRARILLIVGSIVVVLGGLILFLIYNNARKNAAVPATPATSNIIDQGNFNQNAISGQNGGIPAAGIPVKKPTTEEAEKNAVRQLAKIFIERYGSYSSDSDYQNVKDVQGLVTAELWNKISATTVKKAANQPFVGVTATAVSTELTSWQANKAEVAIMLRKVEEKNGGSVTSNQNATIDLIKSGDVWLVEKYEIK